MLSYSVWGGPLGLAAGGYQAYRTAATYRFPFMQPNLERFNPNLFGLMKFQVQGRQAQFMWHLMRTGAYTTFGMWVGGLLVGTYAATVAAVGEQQDPRLQDLIKAIRAKVQGPGSDAPPGDAPGRPRRGQKGDPTGQGTRRASKLWKNHRTAIGADAVSPARPTGTYGDDASPSSGDAYDSYDSSTAADQARSLAMNEGSVLTDRQMRKQEARQRPNPRSSPTETTASTFRIDKVERQPRSFDDDASPTGGEGAFIDSGYESDSGSGATGSTWDRIRQQASSSPSSEMAGRGGRGNRWGMQTPEDSFSFSATEEERQLAKEEAQRSFDERIERERRGGEF